MGCDIHMYAEVRKNNNWEKIGKVFNNPWYNPERESTVDSDGYEWNAKFTDHPYKGRSYNLFAILADVRNGRGFAGIKTGEGFNPISEPKGLPADVTQEVRKEILVFVDEELELSTVQGWVDSNYSEWHEYGKSATSPDYHSESWFTVKELQDYDWGQLTMLRGVVSLAQYITCKDNGTNPDSYSGMVSGQNIVTVDEDVADEIIKGSIPAELKGSDIYVNMHWGVSYKDCCTGFLETTIPNLLKHGSPEDVRIVFWFDN